MMLGRVARMSSLWLSFLTTCCLAWPSAYHHPSYEYNNYYSSPLLSEQLTAPSNPWEVAREPISYENPETYYVEPEEEFIPAEDDTANSQWAEIQALTNLMEMADTAPVSGSWGQILNEKPESELEELKHLQKHPGSEKSVGVTVAPPSSTSAPKLPITQSRKTPPQIILQSHHQGQKEIPLLRPPNKPKPAETIPVLTQRAADEEKPSPYDTLRKYLSIEDALKKEAEKRRASEKNTNHQKKRSFVADEDSLTGQLNNLKKSVV